MSTQTRAKRRRTRYWHSSYEKPPRRGWYECKARDDRWGGKTKWRAWGNGMWWIPLGKGDGSDGWLATEMGIYQWRGPAHDVYGPPPGWSPETRPPAVCQECGRKIDPDVCWCGRPMKSHDLGSGHSPVPMGCACGRISPMAKAAKGRPALSRYIGKKEPV